jgi:hypothetical protein
MSVLVKNKIVLKISKKTNQIRLILSIFAKTGRFSLIFKSLLSTQIELPPPKQIKTPEVVSFPQPGIELFSSCGGLVCEAKRKTIET